MNSYLGDEKDGLFIMKKQEQFDIDNKNLFLALKEFINHINSLDKTVEKTRILSCAFNSYCGDMLLKNFDKIKKYYE